MYYQFDQFIGQPCLACTISLINLSAKHARIVESSGPIYLPNVPVRQDAWVDLLANRSQRVEQRQLYKSLISSTIKLINNQHPSVICISLFLPSILKRPICDPEASICSLSVITLTMTPLLWRSMMISASSLQVIVNTHRSMHRRPSLRNLPNKQRFDRFINILSSFVVHKL